MLQEEEFREKNTDEVNAMVVPYEPMRRVGYVERECV
jgi:hypothetical protein